MRKFSVINAKGTIFDMMRTDAFFSDPSGLGTKAKNSYTTVGTSFINTKTAVEQKKPSGTMNFTGYKQYDEFMNVIKFKPLVLVYEPYEGNVLYMDCDSYEITKEEINHKTNRLECKIKFNGTSTWYHEEKVLKNEPLHRGKKYTYKYPYTYTESASGVINITNQSNLAAYVKITVIGPVKNPSWVLIKSGATVATGKMNLTLKEGQRLVVNSDPANLEICIYDEKNQRLKDVYEKSDFSTDRFIYPPSGESKLTFSHEDANEMKIWAEVKELVE